MKESFFLELRNKLFPPGSEPKRWFLTEDDVKHNTLKEACAHAREHKMRTKYRVRYEKKDFK